ncbi:MAG TPA: hypothetical protein VLD36_08940 [Burkholderiales bacterium]|nr:hypothetical protein [Burkholderiales bacterium]
MRERPVAEVPRWVVALLCATLALQLWIGAYRQSPRAAAEDLGLPPSVDTLRLASFGEPVALGKLLMLHLQAFDYQAGTRVPYRDLDYDRLEAWLARVVALDPLGQYPLMSASRLYAEVPDPAKQRKMLDFVYRAYLEDPDRRWPWLAHATVIAKHELKDLALARQYAVALQKHTTTPDAPVWVRQMEPFILEDMNELEAARILIGGMIASGQVKDPRDIALLERRLELLEERIRAERGRTQ